MIEPLVAANSKTANALDQIQDITKRPSFCSYGAPFIAFIEDGKHAIEQACCDHWDCPRCRVFLVAKLRRRIIYGAETLEAAGVLLYFWTFTCRGRDLDLATADEHYYEWTNRALSRLRAQALREGSFWSYVQVTERQKRGAAHSHFIHTYRPADAVESGVRGSNVRLASVSFLRAVVDAGLGEQCDITRVGEAGRAASYISGYLTKNDATEPFPPNWHRVRYGRKWPKEPEKVMEFCVPLMTRRDWEKVDNQDGWWQVDNVDVLAYAKHRIFKVELK